MRIYTQLTAWRQRRRQSAIVRRDEELARLASENVGLARELDEAIGLCADARQEVSDLEARVARRDKEIVFLRAAAIRDTEQLRDTRAQLGTVRQQRDAALLDLKNERRTAAGLRPLSAADLADIDEDRRHVRLADA